MSIYEPGSVLGDYELLERIGRGGMGEVWLARGPDRDARVAMKVLFPRPDRRAEAAERFEREVAVAARIGHPAIVRVHGCGTDPLGGSMFIVMEHLEGVHLRAWLARREASVLEGLMRMRELLEPLAAAHACTDDRGQPAPIIHRDLKPENVFVLDRADEGGLVKLLDFGIARQAGTTTVTDTGVGMGTAAYMSPEQATDARDVGPSADVWSIGVMLYELLAGRLPFEAPSRNEIISKILTRDPMPLESVAPHVPRRLARIVGACLAKDPAQRPKDARALAARLDLVLDDARASEQLARLALSRSELETAPGPPTLSERSLAPARRRRWTLPVSIATLAAGGALALALWPRAEPTLVSPRTTRTPTGSRDASIEEPNRWVDVAPGVRILGVGDDALDDAESGFRPSANVRAPSEPYAMQQHEVTWAELEAWLPASLTLRVLGDDRPSWLPLDRAARAQLPATGMPWSVARDYCAALGGSLPTEAQWEHAARGDEGRAHAWGDAPPEARADHPVRVMTRAQDRTPHDPPIYDLTGNAREWTLDLWRGGADGATQPWSDEGGRTFRAVRGLPLATPSRWRPPASAPIAHRIPLCATGACPEGTDAVRADVGFRCVR